MGALYIYQYLLEINVHSMYQHYQSFKELVADFVRSIGFYVSELSKEITHGDLSTK